MGFGSIKEYVDALDNGQEWLTSFRKVPSQATTLGTWADLSMAPGNPVPNYYASDPLVAATLEARRGIYHGEAASPGEKYVHSFCIQSPTAGAAPSNWLLSDYLLYYPFIDMDTTDEQVLDNTVTLPRYTDGDGVQAILVALTPYTGGGIATINYTNQSGTSGRVSQSIVSNSALTITSLVNSGAGITNLVGPYIPLQNGDTGIRSVESITFSVVNGGLAALVLIRPIMFASWIREITAPNEFENISSRPGYYKIEDGAYLNLIGEVQGTIAAAVITGYLETVRSAA